MCFTICSFFLSTFFYVLERLSVIKPSRDQLPSQQSTFIANKSYAYPIVFPGRNSNNFCSCAKLPYFILSKMETYGDTEYSTNFSYSYEEEEEKAIEQWPTDWQHLTVPIIYILLACSGLLIYGLVTCIIVNTLIAKAFIHVYVYVGALSLIDIVFLLTTPVTITHMLTTTWTFAQSTCKFIFFCEGLHKSLSICLITGLTGDRYLAVCHPLKFSYLRTPKAAVCFVIISALTSALVSFPLLWFAQLSPGWVQKSAVICGLQFPTLHYTNEHFNSNLLFESPSHAGISSVWLSSGTYYILLICLVYYVLPGVLVIFFSWQICRSVGRHIRFDSGERKSSADRSRVIKLVFAVVVLYFACWTPFWLLQLFIRFSGMSMADRHLAVLAKVIYTLPLLNANMNAILYTFLNKCLRQSYKLSFRKRLSSVRRSSAFRELQMQSERLLTRRSAHTSLSL